MQEPQGLKVKLVPREIRGTLEKLDLKVTQETRAQLVQLAQQVQLVQQVLRVLLVHRAQLVQMQPSRSQ
jgi:hypothetical protein